MSYNLKEFGKRIYRRRDDLNIKQKDLAEMIDISNNHLSNIEKGKSAPSFLTFIDICSALKVSASYLLEGTVFTVDREIFEKLSKKSDESKKIIAKIIDAFPDE